LITHTVHVITSLPSTSDSSPRSERCATRPFTRRATSSNSLWTPLDGGTEVLVVERWRDQVLSSRTTMPSNEHVPRCGEGRVAARRVHEGRGRFQA